MKKRSIIAGLALAVSGCAAMTYEQNPWIIEDLDEHKVKLQRMLVPDTPANQHLITVYPQKLREEAERACALHGRTAGAALSEKTHCPGGYCSSGTKTVLVPCLERD